MTEPKEEKCEACCGSGYINFWTDDGHISMRTCRRCDGYGYIKAKPMTNEEYLKSCNTEQLAEWINNIVDDGIIKAWMIKNNCCGDYLESVKWWLKQPHKGSDTE